MCGQSDIRERKIKVDSKSNEKSSKAVDFENWQENTGKKQQHKKPTATTVKKKIPVTETAKNTGSNTGQRNHDYTGKMISATTPDQQKKKPGDNTDKKISATTPARTLTSVQGFAKNLYSNHHFQSLERNPAFFPLR